MSNPNNEPVVGDENSNKNSEAEQVANTAAKGDEKPPLSMGVLVFTVLNVCGFVFCAAGISIGMMEKKGSTACYSIWGYKPKCLETWFRHIDWDEWGPGKVVCAKGNSLMEGAQTFSVMSIIGGLLTSATAFLELFHYAELAVVAAIMSFINMVAVLVVWSTMLAMYWANLCGQGVFADDYRIGAGLILFITAWCCQFVANATIVVTIALGHAK
ncbi:amastin-like surface protein-like protein [Strigomonas culicis]|uniref:Amastin-like surface protein-like protein n=1 Tax=Strigomonas culicis TaxID=28005 RepID=S9UKZ6_9TRYP|nr:amastin-like surface protein-like protein [Strigomonas culicis]|eukprot:EPY15356.1 amastin-like surface protein-like protein [Strigomonas culicis]